MFLQKQNLELYMLKGEQITTTVNQLKLSYNINNSSYCYFYWNMILNNDNWT